MAEWKVGEKGEDEGKIERQREIRDQERAGHEPRAPHGHIGSLLVVLRKPGKSFVKSVACRSNTGLDIPEKQKWEGKQRI